MLKRTLLLLFIGSLSLILSASEPLPIIFDSDMGSDCDDAGALALLHAYADEGLVDIVACIYSSSKVPYGAGITDAINVYYGRGDVPVGACHALTFGDQKDKMQAEKLARDQAAFGNRIVHNHDAEEQVRLLRQLLASRKKKVTYLTVGHTKALHDLLVSQPDEISPLSGAELIRTKIGRWVALGAIGSKNPQGHYTRDWNFFENETATYTDYLLEHLPVPVYVIDAGSEVLTGATLQKTAPGGIVRTCYRDWLWNEKRKTLKHQRPSWDLAAVYYAVNGPGEFLQNARSGWLDFDPEKGCRWLEDNVPEDHYIVLEKPGVGPSFAEYLNRKIARPPRSR